MNSDPINLSSNTTCTNNSNYDVILGGRRKKIQEKNIGNRRFRVILNLYKTKYQKAATKDDKSRVAYEIIRIIRGVKGRFLCIDPKSGTYIDVDDNGARAFITRMLRHAVYNRCKKFTGSKQLYNKKVKREKQQGDDDDNDDDEKCGSSSFVSSSSKDSLTYAKLLASQQQILKGLLDLDIKDPQEGRFNHSADHCE